MNDGMYTACARVCVWDVFDLKHRLRSFSDIRLVGQRMTYVPDDIHIYTTQVCMLYTRERGRLFYLCAHYYDV